jgi:ketosteroid isomerase-like protein
MPEMHIHTNSTTYGSSARNQLARADGPGLDGARAALETFYHAFNHSDLDTLAAVWHDDQLVQLNNPLGGMLRGREAIRELYARVFDGAGQAQITFSDIVEYATEDVVIFTGRERGTFHNAKNAVALEIRTTRIFWRSPDRWRMVHHHGSIDDPAALSDYQTAVTAAR